MTDKILLFHYSVLVSTNNNVDRLKTLERLLEKNDRKGARLCWIRWDPNSKYGYDITDAREEIQWMIYEIKRLRKDKNELQSFVDQFRTEMESEFKDK